MCLWQVSDSSFTDNVSRDDTKGPRIATTGMNSHGHYADRAAINTKESRLALLLERDRKPGAGRLNGLWFGRNPNG
jgi:hypothetical protein